MYNSPNSSCHLLSWIFAGLDCYVEVKRYLCLTKSIVLPFSVPSSGNNWAQNKLIPRAFSVILLFFLAIAFVLLMSFSYRYHKHLPNLVNASWLLRICLGIWANQKLRIAKNFFWKILIKQILLFQLLVYPGKMLQLLLLWQLTVERQKNRKNAGLPKANSPSDSCFLRILREIQCILHTAWARTVDCFDF